MRSGLIVPSWYNGQFARYGSESEASHLREGLVAAWLSFLGPTGGTLHDMSGRGNHGVLTNMDVGTDWFATVDRWGNTIYALDFDGINDTIITALDLGSFSAITFSCWLKWGGKTGIQRIMHDGGGVYTSIYLATGAVTRIYFGTAGWANNFAVASAVENIPTDWFHVAGVYLGSSYARIYVNGVLIDEDTTDIDASSANPGLDFSIAYNGDFDGEISMALIHNRALTTGEIQELFENPYAMWQRRSRVFGVTEEVITPSPAASLSRGAWQSQFRRGAWQYQAVERTANFSDTLAVTDSLSFDMGKVVSESISFTDLIGLGTTKNVSDILAITDSVALAIAQEFSDNLSVSDDLSLNIGKNFSEVVSLLDSFVTSMGVAFSDILSINDNVALQVSKPFSDSLGITDDFAILLSRAFADLLGLTDTVVFGIGKNFPETLSLTDVLGRVIAYSRSYSDTLGITDDLALTFSKNLADSLGITDAVILSIGAIVHTLNFSENLAISDSLSKYIGKSFSDVITFADDIFRALTYGAELLGNKEIARILADPSAEAAPWMTYIAIGESDIAEDEVHDSALYNEIHRKEGTVWVVRNTFFIKATFGQDEPTGDGYTIKEIGIFDDPTAGILGRRWVLGAFVDKDNLDEVVVECAVTILRGEIESHAEGFTETMGFTDSLSIAFTHGRNFSDTLDISDSLSMVHTVNWPTDAIFNDVIVDGNYLYAAFEDVVDGGGVVAFDITDPTNPVRAGYLNLTATQADAPKRVRQNGNWLYTSDRHGIRTVDVTDNLNMLLGQELVIIAAPASIGGVPTVAINGTDLYHQGQNLGLRKYDATDPTALTLLDILVHGTVHWDLDVGGSPPECSYPAWYAEFAGHGDAFQTDECVVVDGTYVYAASDNTIWVMTHAGSFPTAGVAGNLIACHTCQVGPGGVRTMLAHAGDGGIVMSYGTTNGPNPTYGYLASAPDPVLSSQPVANANVGALAAPVNGYSKFETDGNEGYIVGRPGLVILTQATGAILNTIVGTYRGHVVSGNYLFAAKEAFPSVVDIYDISTPVSPVLVGTAT